MNQHYLGGHVSRQITKCFGSKQFELSVVINDYANNIKTHYGHDLVGLCEQAAIPYAFGFNSFGLLVEFEQEITSKIHSVDMHLNSDLKDLVRQFGAVIIRNIDLHSSIKHMNHKNNFPHLNFHSDRSELQENKYSLYTRDPTDNEQKYPRKASTLFIDNSVAYLQHYTENKLAPSELGRRGHYNIFKESKVSELFGKLILEQPWNAPVGVGEVCIINNNCVLHSSYKHGLDHGYYIGARYLY